MTILIFVCSFIFGYILGKDDMLSKILEKNPDFFFRQGFNYRETSLQI
jgi:hypothetical protein